MSATEHSLTIVDGTSVCTDDCQHRSHFTFEHHPRCDDNGWDHRGPCILEDLP